MDNNLITTIVLAILASNGAFALVQFLITRHDTKKNIKGKLDRLEKDGLRTQLLLMIMLKGDEKKEILTLGQHYFDDLHGNWYMTDIFNKWLEEKGHSKPDWFKHD
jgi:hypothetical protein